MQAPPTRERFRATTAIDDRVDSEGAMTANAPLAGTEVLESLVRGHLAGRAHVRNLRLVVSGTGGSSWRGGRRATTPSNSPSTWQWRSPGCRSWPTGSRWTAGRVGATVRHDRFPTS